MVGVPTEQGYRDFQRAAVRILPEVFPCGCVLQGVRKEEKYTVALWFEDLGQGDELKKHHGVVQVIIDTIIEKGGKRNCHPNWSVVATKVLEMFRDQLLRAKTKGPLFYIWVQYKHHFGSDKEIIAENEMAGHNAGKLNGVDGVYVPRTMEPTEVIMEDVLRSSIRESIDNEENAQFIPGSLEQKRSDVLNNMVCQEMGMHFGV